MIHDGPGIRTVVFLKGCSLRCRWCSSPDTQTPHPETVFVRSLCIRCGACASVCPSGAINMSFAYRIDKSKCVNCGECTKACPTGALRYIGRFMSVDEVIEEVEKDKEFYRMSQGGVTISGGEPLLQGEFTNVLLKECKKCGFHTAIETCGYGSWDVLRETLKYSDLVLYDIKHMDAERHQLYTGVSNRVILHNLQRADERKTTSIIIRYPLIPGYNNDTKNLKTMVKFIKHLKSVKRIEILPYHEFGKHIYANLGKDYPLHDVKAPTFQQKEKARKVLQSAGVEVIVN